MALKLGSLYLLISGKSEPLKKELNKAHGLVRQGATRMQRTISNSFRLAFSLPGLLAGAGGIALFKSMNDAASDLEEVASKFSTVFGDLEGQANVWVDELTESFAMSEREARHYLSSMQDLLEPMGMNAVAAADMSNQVVRLAADLGSFNNLRTEDVMRDIQSALVGNFETMKKYGVVLNQTVIEQEALNTGLIQNKKELDASLRAQVAYNLIVRGSKNAIGDLARTFDSHANQVKQLRANYEDLAAKIGKGLLPITTEYVRKLNVWIDRNDKLFEQDIPGYISKTGDALEGIVNVYNSIPSGVVSSTGAGIIGTMIFGGVGPGAIVAALAYTAQHAVRYSEIWKEAFRRSDIGRLAEAYAEVTEQTNKALRALGLLNEELIDVGTTASGERSWAAIEAQNLANYNKYLDELKKKKIKEELEDQAEAAKKLTEEYIKLLPEVRMYRDSWQVSNERTFTDDQIEKIEELKRSLSGLNTSIFGVQDYYPEDLADQWEESFESISETVDGMKEDAKSSFFEIGELSERTASSMQSNFSNLFSDILSGELKSFEDYFNAFLDSMLRGWSDIMAQMAAQWFFGEGFEGGGILSDILKIFGSGGSSTSSAASDFENISTIRGGEGGSYGFQHGGFIGEPVRGFGKSGKSYEFHPREWVLPDKLIGNRPVENPQVEINVVNNLGREAEVQQSTRWADPNKLIAEVILNEKIESRSFRRGLQR